MVCAWAMHGSILQSLMLRLGNRVHEMLLLLLMQLVLLLLVLLLLVLLLSLKLLVLLQQFMQGLRRVLLVAVGLVHLMLLCWLLK